MNRWGTGPTEREEMTKVKKSYYNRARDTLKLLCWRWTVFHDIVLFARTGPPSCCFGLLFRFSFCPCFLSFVIMPEDRLISVEFLFRIDAEIENVDERCSGCCEFVERLSAQSNFHIWGTLDLQATKGWLMDALKTLRRKVPHCFFPCKRSCILAARASSVSASGFGGVGSKSSRHPTWLYWWS